MYFNYNSYEALIETVGKESKADTKMGEMKAKFVNDCFEGLNEYVKAVDMGETQIKLAYARLDGEELRDTVERIDRTRRFAHEAAISKTSGLNRMCAMSGIDPIFNGNTEDRYQVADFAMEVVQTLFANRTI